MSPTPYQQDPLRCLSAGERNALILAARFRGQNCWARVVGRALGVRGSSLIGPRPERVEAALDQLRARVAEARKQLVNNNPSNETVMRGVRMDNKHPLDPVKRIREEIQAELDALQEKINPLLTQSACLNGALKALEKELPEEERLDEREAEDPPEADRLDEKVREEPVKQKQKPRQKPKSKLKQYEETPPSKNDVWSLIRHDKELKAAPFKPAVIFDQYGATTRADKVRIGSRLRELVKEGKLQQSGYARGTQYEYIRPEKRGNGAGPTSNGSEEKIPGVGSEAPSRGKPVRGTGAGGAVTSQVL